MADDGDTLPDLAPEVRAALADVQAAIERHARDRLAAVELRAAQLDRESTKRATRLQHDAERRAERILQAALEHASVLLDSVEDGRRERAETVSGIESQVMSAPSSQLRRVVRAALHKMREEGWPRGDAERFLVRFGLAEEHGDELDNVYGAGSRRDPRARRRFPWLPWRRRAGRTSPGGKLT
jgi:hypothetical protein